MPGLMGIGCVKMSTPAKSLAISSICDSLSLMVCAPRWRQSSRTPPSIPRPSLISVCSDRDTTSLDASSIMLGAYRSMNRSPSELSRCAPSPLAPSVMSTPLPASVVGWYWTISMSIRGAPAR